MAWGRRYQADGGAVSGALQVAGQQLVQGAQPPLPLARLAPGQLQHAQCHVHQAELQPRQLPHQGRVHTLELTRGGQSPRPPATVAIPALARRPTSCTLWGARETRSPRNEVHAPGRPSGVPLITQAGADRAPLPPIPPPRTAQERWAGGGDSLSHPQRHPERLTSTRRARSLPAPLAVASPAGVPSSPGASPRASDARSPDPLRKAPSSHAVFHPAAFFPETLVRTFCPRRTGSFSHHALFARTFCPVSAKLPPTPS